MWFNYYLSQIELKIHILTNQKSWARGFNDFFPLFKWEKALKINGFDFYYFYNQNHSNLFNCDQLWVEYRYFNSYFDTTDQTIDISPVISFLQKAKSKIGSVVLFDSSDSTGSQCLVLTQYVDLHLKKQLYKDLNLYTINNGDKGFMCWIPEGATPSNIKYYTTDVSQLHKFRLSWNIGMVDYRYFPLSGYYPIGTAILGSNYYNKFRTRSPFSYRDLLTSYRGSISKDTRYSFQRAALLSLLSRFSSTYNIKTGSFINKSDYLSEMQRSRISFSPFGWGEVCYRDFEIFQSGSVLIKPTMEHLTTFPNFYLKNETYIPLKWDMSDAEQIILKLIDTPKEELEQMAKQAQDLFLENQFSAENFVNHFAKMLQE